jgi:SAM-dependent methyltransferase
VVRRRFLGTPRPHFDREAIPMSSELLSGFYESFHRARGKHGTVSFPERFEFIRAEVGTGRRVIELGCRYGDLLAHFVEGNEVTGVDVDREALDACRRTYGVATSVVNLNEALPFADGEFDVAVLSEVLEHLPYPHITLSEIRRILGPGGKLVGSVPHGTRLRNRLRFLTQGTVEMDPTHLFHYSPRSLKALLEEYFAEARVVPASGRYARWHTALSNYLLFSARKAVDG